MASYKKIINKQKKKAKIFLQKYYEYNSISSQNKLSMAHDSKEPPTNHPHQQAKQRNQQTRNIHTQQAKQEHQHTTNQQHPTREARTPTYYKPATSNERSKVSASHGGFPRPPWRSVKKNRVFPVKNEKLFERSEFFSFREMPDFLASERQPALFLFVSFSFVRTKEKRKALAESQKKTVFLFTNFFFDHKEKAPS